MDIKTLKYKLKPSERSAYYFILDESPYDIYKDITVSKIGGIPYWPKDKKYPMFEGNNYKMITQLNLDDLSKKVNLKNISPYYPTTGILQFFLVENDECWEDTLVVYHPDTKKEHFLTEEQIETAFNDEYVGYEESFRITLKNESKELIGCCDSFYHGFLANHIKELKDESLLEIIQCENDEIPESYTSGTKLGGYAYFTQEDPLWDEYNKFIDKYPDELYPLVLLFQIDSDLEDMCWGDCGVANWRIDIEDLKKLDFNNIFYSFDCH